MGPARDRRVCGRLACGTELAAPQALVAGFTHMYRALMEADVRAQVRARIAAMAGLPRRLVFRATRIYSALQREATSAQALRSANARSAVLDQLSRAFVLTSDRPTYWPFLDPEIEAMEDLDIPLLTHELGSGEITPAGPGTPAVPVQDGLAESVQRLADLSEADLARQVRYIRAAVRVSAAAMDQPAPPRPSPRQARWSPTVAAALADRIEARVRTDALIAIDDEPVTTWLIPAVLPDGSHLRLQFTGSGWYDGRAGLLPVLLRGSTPPDDVARLTVERFRRLLEYDDGRLAQQVVRRMTPGMGGLGGVLRTFTWLHREGVEAPPKLDAAGGPDQRASVWQDLAGPWAGVLTPPQLIQGLEPDPMMGVAGLIPPLTDPHCGVDPDRATAIIVAAADRIVAAQDESGGWRAWDSRAPLTGLSHGASGLAWALHCAGRHTGVQRYHDAADRALAYEASVFDPATGNWPDFRGSEPRPPALAWCTGASGIGLIRSRLLGLLPDHPDTDRWRDQLEIAMRSSSGDLSVGSPFDHVCCGAAGRAWILAALGEVHERADWRAAGETILAGVVAGCGADRFPRTVSLPDGDPAGLVPVGVMTGVSGVALVIRYWDRPQDLLTLFT